LEPYFRERRTDQKGTLSHQPSGSIYFVDVTQLDISATRIREIFKTGKSARYLIPEPLRRFILDQRLYLSS
jgi:nicotinate-nucleotide adenylyltransferase